MLNACIVTTGAKSYSTDTAKAIVALFEVVWPWV